jgi:hypothetical protein
VSRPLATAANSGKFLESSETIIPPLGEIRLGGIAYVGVLMVELFRSVKRLLEEVRVCRNPCHDWAEWLRVPKTFGESLRVLSQIHV